MRRSLFIILFILCYLSGYSFFEKDIRVLTMQNGLADNTVSCIHKDRDGFMWFGTDNGLSRYDGKNIRNFGLDERYMKVNHIRESADNLLWLIANGQIYCFDRRMERYIPVSLNGKYTGVQDIL
ncbi:two-component regulator propeller domain-containing protein, partial [Parabacteroides sp.]|uniref:two-component regulator propeller domain-containing protein n=1 Tax=Parabacteroides sp. TaxID=1869337 RepID=UPI003080EFCF